MVDFTFRLCWDRLCHFNSPRTKRENDNYSRAMELAKLAKEMLQGHKEVENVKLKLGAPSLWDFVQVVRPTVEQATRVHFSVNQSLLDVLATQESSYKRETFFDFVYDTNNYDLLKAGLWLLLRQSSTGEHHWRLRYVKRIDEKLESLEVLKSINGT